MDKPFKTIKEHIARAKAYANRMELVKALASLTQGVKTLQESSIFGREKFEIEILFNEVLHNLNSIQRIQELHPEGLKYVRGQEKKLYTALLRTYKTLKEAEDKARIEEVRARMNEIDKAMLAAQRMLDANKPADARKIFRAVTAKYPDVHGVFFDCGNRLLGAGLPQESMEYFENALEQDIRDPRPYSGMATAWEELHEPERAEQVLRDALRIFGTNESIYTRLSRLLIKARKWDEAYDCAKSALEINPSSREAKMLVSKLEPKIFTRSAGQ